MNIYGYGLNLCKANMPNTPQTVQTSWVLRRVNVQDEGVYSNRTNIKIIGFDEVFKDDPIATEHFEVSLCFCETKKNAE